MAQYSARFIDNFATITEPLRALSKQDSEWHRTKVQEDAFEQVKSVLSENTTLAYFDPQKHKEIHVDASPVRIAVILSQNGCQIAYASRSLTSIERRYSQTERETTRITRTSTVAHR